MRLFYKQIFDDYIFAVGGAQFYVPSSLDVSVVDSLAFMVVVEKVSGTSPTIGLVAYPSNNDQNLGQASATLVASASVAANATTVLTGTYAPTHSFLTHMAVLVGGTNVGCRVKVYACGRGKGQSADMPALSGGMCSGGNCGCSGGGCGGTDKYKALGPGMIPLAEAMSSSTVAPGSSGSFSRPGPAWTWWFSEDNPCSDAYRQKHQVNCSTACGAGGSCGRCIACQVNNWMISARCAKQKGDVVDFSAFSKMVDGWFATKCPNATDCDTKYKTCVTTTTDLDAIDKCTKCA